MLKPINRLEKDADIKRVYQKGKSTFDSVAGIKALPNGLAYSRFAIASGVKVSKSAVDRNRVKRQYREHIKSELAALKPGYDLLVILSPKALTTAFETQAELLHATLKKAGLLL